MTAFKPIGDGLQGMNLPALGITVERPSLQALYEQHSDWFRDLPDAEAIAATIARLAQDASRGVYRPEMGPSRLDNPRAIATWYAAGIERQEMLLERRRFYEAGPAQPDRATEEAEQAKQLRISLAVERWANSGVPEPFKTLSWDGLVDRDPSKRPLIEALASWRETPDWLLLHGDPGRGKTGMACCLAKDFARGAQSVLFVRVPSMLADLRRSYDPERRSGDASLLDRLHNVEVLILDDLGAERLTDSGWVLEMLDMLIDSRWSNAAKRRTIVTTNLLPTPDPRHPGVESLAERVGPRISSRLIGTAVSLEVGGDDLRTGAAA